MTPPLPEGLHSHLLIRQLFGIYTRTLLNLPYSLNTVMAAP